VAGLDQVGGALGAGRPRRRPGLARRRLFDRSGNAGTTAWVDGRVVGCWVQDDAETVRVRLLEPVAARARRDLAAEAARLTGWLAGVRVGTGYVSAAMRAPGPAPLAEERVHTLPRTVACCRA